MNDSFEQQVRMAEALLFAAAEPLDRNTLIARLPDGVDVDAVIAALTESYAPRGVNLVKVGGKWAFRTAADLHFLLTEEREQTRKLSRAALETLAIVAYHQPVTRAEIEEIRGVGLSKGTLDQLMEIGWVRPRGRRRTLGRPVTYGTSDLFLEHFNLENTRDLPGFDELKASGLLDSQVPAALPASLQEAEDPLGEDEDPDDLAETLESLDEEPVSNVVPMERG